MCSQLLLSRAGHLPADGKWCASSLFCLVYMCTSVTSQLPLSLYSMETTIDTKSTIILSGRANSQIQNTIFQYSYHQQLCIFTSFLQTLHAVLIKIAPAEATHCFTDAVTVSLPKQVEVRRNQNPDYTVGEIGQSHRDWQCASWSSNWYRSWCYCVVRERLPSPLVSLLKFVHSVQSSSLCSSQR